MDKGLINAIYILSTKEREILRELRPSLEALTKLKSIKNYLYDVLEKRR
jgi:hypothetical protein